ncbi:MAG TPA: DUF1015 family protein [Vicinamibacterales bacterium]|nr:DUF1015 family protein [Vicinamibacterales bacterium]HPW19568.1 DUF1015 family protein [Vicinamibacterales bacterium]
MAKIRPFRALRPEPALASRIASVPYDVVSAEEARALAAGDELSFLHVSRAEIDLPPGTDPYSDLVYRTAAERFARTRRSMVVEAEPALYFYRLRMGAHEQTGLAACYSVDEYEAGLIKKHEKTRRDKEDDRTRHITELRAQTGPVLLVYAASPEVDAVAARVARTGPLYDLVAPDGVAHTVWKVTGADLDVLVAAFGRVPALYIADGHHRAASAARSRKALAPEAGEDGVVEADWFLAVAFPDDQTQVLPYNRVVKDLAGLTPEAFLDRVRGAFAVAEGGPASPVRQGACAMYLGGRWYTLDISARAGAGVVGRLDVSVLQDRLLAPILAIGDVRTDKRIDFVGGIRGTSELERLVDEGKAAVAFSMYPVSVGDLMAIADAGEIMPPKSTWFEPKLRDALLVHLI